VELRRDHPASRRHRAWAYVKALYWKGYEDNVTGLAGMVAYNLLLSLFPLALVALFVTGTVLESSSLEARAIADLRRLFPSTSEHTITRLLVHIRDNATSFGVIALITSIWFGASFWGALDTAFCRIYHVECRKWVEQKRFALLMLFVILLLMAATVVVPTAQGILTRGAHELPFGLSHLGGVIYVVTLLAGLSVLFGVLCLIYWAVPNRFVPWRAVWPGAAAATVAMGVVDYVFPVYLGGSPLQQVGSTVVFVVILLIWFYSLAFIILGGALINATRFEVHDTGRLSVGSGNG
jgi:YihY family inner membrane protein